MQNGIPDGNDHAPWSDVIFTEGPEPTITYRTGWVVYEESLTGGNYVGRGWNGAGFVNFYDGRINPLEHPSPQAFWLEVDGQLLASAWEWAGFRKCPDDRGLAAACSSFPPRPSPNTCCACAGWTSRAATASPGMTPGRLAIWMASP